MIISHAYKYVFLRTRKTASSSTALYLMQNLFEEGDVTIRDLRQEYDHPAPTLYDDSVINYTLKYIIENNLVDLNRYKVYATLRDPYERIVSRVFYKEEAKDLFMAQKILAKGYVDEVDMLNPQAAYIVYDGEVKANIINYVTLESDLRKILVEHGKEERHPLAKLKSGIRPSWATVETVITPKIKAKVDEVFCEDLKLWKYYQSQLIEHTL